MERNSDKLGAPSVTPAMWEQRRYEIAKEMLPKCLTFCNTQQDAMKRAVLYADNLIEELKKPRQ